MIKKSIHILIFILIASITYSQKIISGESEAVKINLSPKFERGLPPNLYVNLSFEDENNNGLLEPNESAIIKILISNKGKGIAQGLLVRVKDNIDEPELIIDDGIRIPFLYPNNSVEIEIPLKANFNIRTAEHKLKIEVFEHYGYDMDNAFLVLNTLEYLAPEIVLSGVEVIDFGKGTAAIIVDGLLEPGELAKVRVMVQNIGKSISENTSYEVFTADKNVYVDDVVGDLGDIDIGEVKSFWLTISPNKRISSGEELPIYIRVKNKYNIGGIVYQQLPITLNQRPPDPKVVEIQAIMDGFKKEVARFEYTSSKITANISEIINIKEIPNSLTTRPNSVAVIIGIEEYKYFVPAPYAVNDANIIKNYFKTVLGVNEVLVYTNQQVSGFFFENMFEPNEGDLQKAIIKGETELFVFYSGHGIPSKNGKKVYLFPFDGKKNTISTQGYDINSFYQNLNALGAKTTTVFIDACFSGVSRASEDYEKKNLMAMKGVSIKPKITHPWEINNSFNVFASSSFEETSLAFDQSKTGLFTYYICAGLQGYADRNNDGKISNGELKDYVIEMVGETSVKILGKQTPIFHGNPNYLLFEF